jgi:hypothetical protein
MRKRKAAQTSGGDVCRVSNLPHRAFSRLNHRALELQVGWWPEISGSPDAY